MVVRRRPKKVLIQFVLAGVLAVIIGIGAIALTFMVISNATTAANKKTEETEAIAKKLKAENERLMKETTEKKAVENYMEVQAIRDIDPGEVITKAMVEAVKVENPPPAVVLKRTSDAVGKYAVGRLLAGETLTRDKVRKYDNMLQVDEGMRAVTIPVDNIGSVGGALMPGSLVDILTTISQNNQTFSKTLLQGIQVISMGSALAAPTPGAAAMAPTSGAVTVAVTPQQAELLTLAQNIGKFQLTLRNFKDHQKVKVSGADLDYLITGRMAPLPLVPANLPAMQLPAGGNILPANLTQSDLPNPTDDSGMGSKGGFTMEIYKGSGKDSYNFDQP
ncbi:MAG: Flp pilus assembly protein CpaB [Candidatus Melainabacteria bacterium]